MPKNLANRPFKGRKIVKRTNDHILIKRLIDKGYSRQMVSRTLGMSINTFYKVLNNPFQYLSLERMTILAALLEVPVLQVVCLCLGKREGVAREEGAKWYESNL